MVAIKGFVKNSLIEWEGNIVSIVFLSQCNLRCHYCHSPHLVKNPCELETIPVDDVLENVSNNKDWLDGIVISGGEPTLQKGLDKFIKLFRDIGLKIKLDTNGTNPDILEKLFDEGLIDYFAMDIKAPLEKDKYDEVIGIDFDIEKIKKSVKLIMESGVDYEFRTTVCPTYLGKSDIEDIAKVIKGAERYIIQPFRPNICLNEKLLDVSPYPLDILEEFAAIADKYVKRCWVRGHQKEVTNTFW